MGLSYTNSLAGSDSHFFSSQLLGKTYYTVPKTNILCQKAKTPKYLSVGTMGYLHATFLFTLSAEKRLQT